MTGTDFGSQYSLWDLSCAFKNGGVGGGGAVGLNCSCV